MSRLKDMENRKGTTEILLLRHEKKSSLNKFITGYEKRKPIRKNS